MRSVFPTATTAALLAAVLLSALLLSALILPAAAGAATGGATGAAAAQQSLQQQVTAAQASGSINGQVAAPGMLASSGCMVCHGDPKISMKVGKKMVSLYVDPKDVETTIHRNLACTDCHVDFGFRVHTTAQGGWKKVAGMACAKCHTHRKQNEAFSSSFHATATKLRPGRVPPNCADCHGAHNIGRLTKAGPYRTWFRARAKEVCGNCHPKFYKAYSDYYHGQAYKQGAVDAPACWDCHDAHLIFPTRDPRSTVGALKIEKTCDKCHQNSSKDFTKYAELIHRKQQATQKTFLTGTLGSVGRVVSPVWSIVVGWLGKAKDQGVGVLRIFFPQSLRPQK